VGALVLAAGGAVGAFVLAAGGVVGALVLAAGGVLGALVLAAGGVIGALVLAAEGVAGALLFAAGVVGALTRCALARAAASPTGSSLEPASSATASSSEVSSPPKGCTHPVPATTKEVESTSAGVIFGNDLIFTFSCVRLRRIPRDEAPPALRQRVRSPRPKSLMRSLRLKRIGVDGGDPFRERRAFGRNRAPLSAAAGTLSNRCQNPMDPHVTSP
jgi:hypothetical protein